MPDTTPTREQRDHTRTDGRSIVGRSEVHIECPFCGVTVTAYLWSLAGSGKLCPCGAKHTAYGVTTRAVTA